MDHNELINKFYTAFSNGDSKEMTACYHENVRFTDPAFGTLEGKRACKMWEMLLSRGTQSKITFSNINIDGDTGSANWRAEYNFGPKKRKVINLVSAHFKFKDGKIIEHVDTFDVWKWSKQAMGPVGHLMGWSSFLKNKIQKTTGEQLDKYMAKN